MKKIALLILALSLLAGLSHAIDRKNFVPKPVPPGTSILKPPSLTVLTPNGGDTWGIGAYVHVTWSAANLTQKVNVWLKIAGSDAIFAIQQNVPVGTKNAVYTVPANFGYAGKIFKVVVATVDGKVKDESDDTFTIRKMNVSAYMTDANEQQYSGPCPVTLTFHAQIGTEFPGWVNYNFFFEDGSESQTFSIFVDAVKNVTCARNINGTLQGHVTIHIQSPNQANSANSSFFNVLCPGTAK